MKRALAVLVLLLMPALAFAAASSTTVWISGQPVKVVKVDWTSDAAGEVWADLGSVIEGKIFAVKTIPSATVGAVPTDNYDVYVKDYTSSFNYLTTTLENRDTADTEMIAPANVPVYGNVGFSVSAAGDTNSGAAWLYIEVPK